LFRDSYVDKYQTFDILGEANDYDMLFLNLIPFCCDLVSDI